MNKKNKKLSFIVNLKGFKKWLSKNIGKKCSDYNWDCFVCRSWRIYEEMKGYCEYIEDLDKK